MPDRVFKAWEWVWSFRQALLTMLGQWARACTHLYFVTLLKAQMEIWLQTRPELQVWNSQVYSSQAFIT